MVCACAMAANRKNRVTIKDTRSLLVGMGPRSGGGGTENSDAGTQLQDCLSTMVVFCVHDSGFLNRFGAGTHGLAAIHQAAAGPRRRGGCRLVLFVDGPAEAEHVSVVIDDLEGPEP